MANDPPRTVCSDSIALIYLFPQDVIFNPISFLFIHSSLTIVIQEAVNWNKAKMTDRNLYSATYSGVTVYEYIHPKSSVMRRKNDGWVNATHILKVADFPKAKRTRILERDVQTGTHEKVQGGYGKYQGTWVPMERAAEIAKQFGVYDELGPLLRYKHSDGSATPPPAPKHHHATSEARKASKAGRTTSLPLRRVKPQIENVQVPAKRSYSSQLKRTTKRTLKAPRGVSNAGNRRQQRTHTRVQELPTPRVDTSDDSDSFIDSDSDSVAGARILSSTAIGRQVSTLSESSSPGEFLSDADIDRALTSGRQQRHAQRNGDFRPDQAEQIRQQLRLAQQDDEQNPKKKFAGKLLEYFLNSEDSSTATLPTFITDQYVDFDLNQPIDKDGNTTFHWACAMGDLKMCQALLNRGCNARALNNKGEVPIMRSVMYTNSYTRRTFAKMLDLLRDSLLDADTHGRTILHHIAFSTSAHSNLPAARYNTEILLTKIAETVQPMERIINFINQQDDEGNTALHIFSFNSARKCIRIMLGYNARVDIPNARNEFVSDYLYNNLGAGNSDAPILSQQTQSQTNRPESFNHMTKFNPSFRGGVSLLSPVRPAEPLSPQLAPGFLTSQHLTIPHYSEVAMQVSQRSGELVEKLVQLASSFDSEVHQKDSDTKELRMILNQLNDDITRTEQGVKKIMETILQDKYDEAKPFEENVELAKQQVSKLGESYVEKMEQLRRMIERTQAKDLALVVQQLEQQDLKGKRPKAPRLDTTTVQLLLELAKLQLQRKHAVNELVNMYADASPNREAISNYRRLVSRLSNVPLEDVDEGLDDIEECLKADN